MEILDQQLLGGSAAADALRRAKEAMRRTHPEPFHWAGFMCTGRIESVPGMPHHSSPQ